MRNHQEIIIEVADYFGVEPREVLGRGRQLARICMLRHLCMWLMRKHIADISLSEIAKRMGLRDHSTICNGIARTDAKIAADPGFAAQVLVIESHLFDSTANVGAA
jgi:chromosomal replication initiation ATPase DnaA